MCMSVMQWDGYYHRRYSHLVLVYYPYCALSAVQKLNAYRAGHIFVSMFQFNNCGTDSGELWYVHYATDEYPKFISFNFLQSIIQT
jgi:hypothetical protein